MSTKKRLQRAIARSHSNRAAQLLARAASMYLNSFHNRSASADWNGESRVIQVVTEFSPAVVFDVGANVGDWTRRFLAASPNSAVHAFEPVPLTADVYRQDTGGRAKLTETALGASDGFTTVFVPAGTTSVLASAVLKGHGSPIECEVLRGDRYCEENAIAKIDFMKIDVEGGEFSVLQGFARMLSSNSIRAIQFEFSEASTAARVLLADIYELLPDFHIGKVYPDTVDFRPYCPSMEQWAGLNYVAVHESWTELRTALA